MNNKTCMENYEIENYAMKLHYDSWDTEGMEESNLPKRINRYSYFILSYVPLQKILEPDFEIEDEKVDMYSEMNCDTMPPIVLGRKISGKHIIMDGCHRFSVAVKKGITHIWAYIPGKLYRKNDTKNLYHICKKRNLQSIMKEGLIPQIRSHSRIMNEVESVFLFPEKDVMENALMNQFGELHGEDEELVSLEIILPNDFPIFKGDTKYEVLSYSTIPPQNIKLFRNE